MRGRETSTKTNNNKTDQDRAKAQLRCISWQIPSKDFQSLKFLEVFIFILPASLVVIDSITL
jgi:hypothetical protein